MPIIDTPKPVPSPDPVSLGAKLLVSQSISCPPNGCTVSVEYTFTNDDGTVKFVESGKKRSKAVRRNVVVGAAATPIRHTLVLASSEPLDHVDVDEAIIEADGRTTSTAFTVGIR